MGQGYRSWRPDLVLTLIVVVFTVALGLAGCSLWTGEPQPPDSQQQEPLVTEVGGGPVADGSRPSSDSEGLPKETGIKIEVAASGLEVPWGMDFAPGGELFFTERPERVRLLLPGGELVTLATLPDTAAIAEGGLLGLALHPEFPRTGFLYVYQTYYLSRNTLANRILRFRFDAENQRLIERTTVFDGIPGGRIHDGGGLRFGTDGKLYVTTGDAGWDVQAQDHNLLGGKILRLNPNGTIPADNPLGADSSVYSLGHRNPQGLAVHPRNGLLYSTEHGSSGLDEVNLIKAGANYGWPEQRGLQHGRFEGPLQAYSPTIAPSGADFYNGPIRQWANDLFFGTLSFSGGAGRHLHRIRFGEDGRTIVAEEELFRNEYGRIRAVRTGPDGCLYFSTSSRDGRGNPSPDDDRILRLCPDRQRGRIP